MNFTGFSAEDFNVFTIDGLEPRMEALTTRIRPKLETIGQQLAQDLSALTGEVMFPHVAKHARRTINPPNDTWVAFAANKRGYKMLPHFQVGLWETHVFIWFAVIYEAPDKAKIGKNLEENLSAIRKQIPEDYVWSVDHMKPEVLPHSNLSEDDLLKMTDRLQNVKKAELLCGYQIPREKAVKMSGKELYRTFHDVFVTLLPLYKLT
ncbi:MAG: YktB family protein [Bacillus sp. (in: firmicutes)]